MWRNSRSFSSKLLFSHNTNGLLRPHPPSRFHPNLSNSSSAPPLSESLKLGFQGSNGIRAATAVDFSSLAASKAREAADLARHYGRCYYELSKARLRKVSPHNGFDMDPDVHSLARMLQSCNTHHSIYVGKQLHLFFLKKGLLNSDVTIGNRLLQMYVRCGNLSDSCLLFEELPLRNRFSWNTMIEGHMKLGFHKKSLELFKCMPNKNDFSWNVIISGFTKAGLLDVARCLFDDMPVKTGLVWTFMINGYAQNGYQREALRLFKHLSLNYLEESCFDKFLFTTVIGVCTELAALGCGKQIHARILINKVEIDSILASSLVNLYGKCGDLCSANYVLNMMEEPDDYSLSALILSYANLGQMGDARRVFYVKCNPGVALWNSLISGYVRNNENLMALILFNEMRAKGFQGDSLTLVSVLSASSNLGILGHIKQLHTYSSKVGVIVNIVVASALLDSYSKCRSFDAACKLFSELRAFDTILLNCMITVYSNCGRIEDAKKIFKTMPSKSLISWNSMIVGLYQNGCPTEALDLFREMSKLGLKIDKFSLASAISACAFISSLEFGEQVFARATVTGLEQNEIVANSLVDFYCKCGLVENGRKLFDKMVKSDEVPWNTLLMGYATNGYGMEALTLFNEMRQAGVTPNDITFTAVLYACSHCGLVEEGRRWFYTMKWEYHIDPSIEHYACLVDLFSRAGSIEEAMNLIEQMPVKADVSMLSSVLRGCAANGDKALGKKVAEQIIELDYENSGAYVQLSNIFASFGEWEGSEEIRKEMKLKRIQKNAGCSWSEC